MEKAEQNVENSKPSECILQQIRQKEQISKELK